MSCEGVSIQPATQGDLGDILGLLSAVDLPHEGVAEHLEGFLVARDGEGRLVGAIGLERHGSVGLLRSAAVAPGLQRSGLGSCLTSALLRRAQGDGIEKVVLLTTTARDFFARRFGFSEADRAAFDRELSGSSEWGLPRCSSAACMALDLKGEASWRNS
jgi:N-acetylglutamate synthase-like GNAT family acetyltransferase